MKQVPQKSKDFKRRRGKRKIKSKKTQLTKPDLSVKVLLKNSNGSANWDQLFKVLGSQVKKDDNSLHKAKFVNQPKFKHKRRKKDMSETTTVHKQEASNSPSSNSLENNLLHSNKSNTSNSITKPQERDFLSTKSNNGNSSTINDFTNNDVKPKILNYKKKRSKEKKMQDNTHIKNLNSKFHGISIFDQSLQNKEQHKNITNVIAMDCEMVGTGKNGEDSIIARVSIVNKFGDCIYDAYVRPIEPVTDYRTAVSGIRPSDLTKGKDLFSVQKEVQEILDNRILVGHALKNDLSVLFLSHPQSRIRDTSSYKPLRQLFNGKTPSLKKLAEKLLGVNIQTGEHSSVEDAQAAMQIYLMHKKQWEDTEKYHKKKRHQRPSLPLQTL